MADRLPMLTPDELDEDQQAVHRQIAGGRRAEGPQLFALTDDDGALHGPFNALLHAPEVGGALGRLGEAIRYRSSLSDRVREIAILTVAAHHRSDFEWYAHARVGAHVGLTEDEIQRIRRLGPLEGPPEETLAYDLCRAALADRAISDDLHDGAVGQLGRTAVVELVMLVGYYQALALLLSVFGVPSPEPVTWPDTSRPG